MRRVGSRWVRVTQHDVCDAYAALIAYEGPPELAVSSVASRFGLPPVEEDDPASVHALRCEALEAIRGRVWAGLDVRLVCMCTVYVLPASLPWSDAAARGAARATAGDEGAGAGHCATPQAAADVHMPEAGPSSEAGHATPEGARADSAATPTRTGDTLHMHSVAGTAKRRQKLKARSTRGHDRVEAALASAVDRELAKRARDAPPSDGLADETEMT